MIIGPLPLFMAKFHGDERPTGNHKHYPSIIFIYIYFILIHVDRNSC